MIKAYKGNKSTKWSRGNETAFEPLSKKYNAKLNKIFNIKPSSKKNNRFGSTNYEIKGTYIFYKLFGNDIVIENLHRFRFFIIPGIIKEMNNVIESVRLKNVGITLKEMLKVFEDYGVKMYVHGGFVRDLFSGKRSDDIDLVFDAHIETIRKVCIEQKWPCPEINEQYGYVAFDYDMKGMMIEGIEIDNTFFKPIIDHDFTINGLAYGFTDKVLIDISGKGFFDVINNRIRISTYETYIDQWMKRDWKKPLRYFKLIMKGYKPHSREFHETIVEYIEKNLKKVYLGKLYRGVSRIKHFLIKNLTYGDIEQGENGEEIVTVGTEKDKLIPFLRALGESLSAKTLNRIMKEIDDI